MTKYILKYRDFGKIEYTPIYAGNILQARTQAEQILHQNFCSIGWIITKTGKQFSVTV